MMYDIKEFLKFTDNDGGGVNSRGIYRVKEFLTKRNNKLSIFTVGIAFIKTWKSSADQFAKVGIAKELLFVKLTRRLSLFTENILADS